ncbi:peptide transporter, partial [Oceanidesulfovibrio marinus]
LAIGVIGVYHVVKSFRSTSGKLDFSILFNPPKDRGDINFWVSIAIDVVSILAHVGLCIFMVPNFPWYFFMIYGFLYTTIMSYVTARMEGSDGQFVSRRLVREASGIAGAKYFVYQGIENWYAPMPIHNYGTATLHIREIELPGAGLPGVIKAESLVFHVVMSSSRMFSQFLWILAPMPSGS